MNLAILATPAKDEIGNAERLILPKSFNSRYNQKIPSPSPLVGLKWVHDPKSPLVATSIETDCTSRLDKTLCCNVSVTCSSYIPAVLQHRATKVQETPPMHITTALARASPSPQSFPLPPPPTTKAPTPLKAKPHTPSPPTPPSAAPSRPRSSAPASCPGSAARTPGSPRRNPPCPSGTPSS